MTATHATVIPAPPRDDALAALPLALNGDVVAGLLADELGWPVAACRPSYVRYKRGTNCLVLYRVTDEAGSATLVHAKLFPAAEAERRRAKDPSVGSLRALDALVYRYPDDPKLPALARIGAGRVVRYKPGRRAVLRLEGPERYAKLYSDERGSATFRLAAAVARAGVPTAAPVDYAPRERMLLLPAVAGDRLDRLGERAFQQAIPHVAAALERLHEARVEPPAPGNERDRLRRARRGVEAIRPDLAPRARALEGALADAAEGADRHDALVHGDFSPDQILLAGGRPTILDLDGAHAGDALLDAGNFLAHLAVDEPDRDAARVRSVFSASATSNERALLRYEALGILKLAVLPFRRLEPDWPHAVEQRLALAEERVREAGRPALRPRPPADRALPQLGVLLDPRSAASHLAPLLGDVRVHHVAVVRHKPGRRCTLRFDVEGGDGTATRLYGKTYASDRARRVNATARALARARAFGADVVAPDPVGCVETLRLVVQREVPGTPIDDALRVAAPRLVCRIAVALHRLHTSGVGLERVWTLADELAVLRARVAGICSAAFARRAEACLSRVERLADAGWTWRRVPVHRDFYPAQVLVSGSRLGILDVDDAALSEPAVDVANFAAHVRLLAVDQPADAPAIATAAEAFETCCADLDPDLDVELVRLLRGATLLRLACIHGTRDARLAGRLLTAAEGDLA